MKRLYLFGSLMYDCHSTPYIVCQVVIGCQTHTLSCLGFLIFEGSVQLAWDKRENCILTKAIFRKEILGILFIKWYTNLLFHFSHTSPVLPQSSNLNSFMHLIKTCLLNTYYMTKNVTETEIVVINKTELFKSLHSSGENDDSQRYCNLFVSTVSDCWQNVSYDRSVVGSHGHNLMSFRNCTTEERQLDQI